MNKKSILTTLLVAFSLLSFGQKMDDSKVILPTKDGNIFFEQVIEIPNADKETIFNASLKWLATTFVDANEVIQLKDKETGAIVGKGNFSFTEKGFWGDGHTLWFMIDITCKENKIRLRIHKFQTRITDGGSYPLEDRYNAYLKEMQWPKADKKFYLAFKERVEGIINECQVYLKSNAIKDDF